MSVDLCLDLALIVLGLSLVFTSVLTLLSMILDRRIQPSPVRSPAATRLRLFTRRRHQRVNFSSISAPSVGSRRGGFLVIGLEDLDYAAFRGSAKPQLEDRAAQI